MQVITNEFKDAVMLSLSTMPEGTYLTVKQLCEKTGVNQMYMPVITLLLKLPEFADYESVKSKGTRRRKTIAPIVQS